MVELTNETLKNANEKARATKPLVKVIEFRLYSVTNRETGANYTVKFSKIGNKKFGECNCKCGTAGKYVCKHISASLPIHLVLASQAQTM